MFRSGMTKGIYKNFLRGYRLNRAEISLSTYVYADVVSGEVRLITNLYQTKESDSEIYAVSIESQGTLELLSTE